MKNYYLSLLTMLAFSTTNAQITITNDALAPAGTTIYMGYDTIAQNQITPGAPGANMTWDYSILTPHEADTVSLMLPAETPYGDDFPFANFAVGLTSNDQFAFFTRNSNVLSNVGVAGDGGDYGFVVANFEPANIYLDFPVNYGNSRVENYSLDVRIADNSFPGVDSVRYKTSTEEHLAVDAWGTMILPIGTFDVLRQKEEKTIRDTIWTRFFSNWIVLSTSVTETDTYNWWTNDVGAGFTLCSIDVDRPTMEVTSVTFLNSYTVGLETNQAELVSCFPNPTSSVLKIAYPENINPKDVIVSNMMGQLFNVPIQNGVGFITLKMNNLPSGLYVITLHVEGRQPIIKKIIKQD